LRAQGGGRRRGERLVVRVDLIGDQDRECRNRGGSSPRCGGSRSGRGRRNERVVCHDRAQPRRAGAVLVRPLLRLLLPRNRRLQRLVVCRGQDNWTTNYWMNAIDAVSRFRPPARGNNPWW